MKNGDPSNRVFGYILDKIILNLLFFSSLYLLTDYLGRRSDNTIFYDGTFVVILIAVFAIFYHTIKKYNATPGMKLLNLKFENPQYAKRVNTLFVTIAYIIFLSGVVPLGAIINILPLYIGKKNNRYDQTLMNKITKVRVVDLSLNQIRRRKKLRLKKK